MSDQSTAPGESVEQSEHQENPGAGAAQGREDGAKADGLHGLYDLSSTPEELRPYAEDLLAQVSKNVDAKFREHADYRKGWAPFEELGLRDMDPQELNELLTFRNEILSDPEALQQWLAAVSEHTGWKPQLDQDAWLALGEENGWFEDEGSGGEDQPASLSQQIEAMLEQRLKPLEEFVHETRSQSEVSQIRQQLEKQLDDLEAEHGDFDRNAVVRLAHAYDAEGSEDPIADAFEEYQRLRGSSQADLLDEKADQPDAALGTGQADTAPEKFTALDDPGLKEAVRRRLAASR